MLQYVQYNRQHYNGNHHHFLQPTHIWIVALVTERVCGFFLLPACGSDLLPSQSLLIFSEGFGLLPWQQRGCVDQACCLLNPFLVSDSWSPSVSMAPQHQQDLR